MKNLFYFIFLFLFFFSCNSDDDNSVEQTQQIDFRFTFNNVAYYGVKEYLEDQYVGWVWYDENRNEDIPGSPIVSYTISANVSTDENQNFEEPVSDLFLDFQASEINSGATYPISSFVFWSEQFEYQYWGCEDCSNGSVYISDKKDDNSISGNFSIHSATYGTISGSFSNIPD